MKPKLRKLDVISLMYMYNVDVKVSVVDIALHSARKRKSLPYSRQYAFERTLEQLTELGLVCKDCNGDCLRLQQFVKMYSLTEDGTKIAKEIVRRIHDNKPRQRSETQAVAVA